MNHSHGTKRLSLSLAYLRELQERRGGQVEIKQNNKLYRLAHCGEE